MFDVDGAVDHLNEAADDLKESQIAEGKPDKFGEGRCAHYVADAIEDGGDVPATPRPRNAKDFGPWLEANHFGEVAAWNGTGTLPPSGYVAGYMPQAGDVVVMQPYTGGNPSGHMAMYNGDQWVSDFRQNSIWPGPGYNKQQPAYIIYRYGIRLASL